MKTEAIIRSNKALVRTVQPWTPVRTAIDLLAGPPRIGALVVTGVEHGFTGVFDERDLTVALHRHGARLLDMRVEDVMTRDVPTCTPSDNITFGMVEMTRTRRRHLPVTENSDLVGIVSIGDLIRARLDEMRLETGVLRDLYLASRH